MVLGICLNKGNASADTCEDECCARCDTQIHPSTSNEPSQEFSSVSVILDKVLTTPGSSRRSSYHLESKVDMVCGLLSMLGGQEHADMGETLLSLSTNPESCLAMRQSGCVPLLVQLMQLDKDSDTRNKAAKAICNLITAQPDEKIRKREIKIFRFLEEIKGYTEELRKGKHTQEDQKHPLEVCIHLMKLSFDEDHRQVICHFGGIHDLANLIEAEHVHHGATPDVPACNSLRKYICMSLTNVTFSDSGNKALLCSYRKFMRAIVVQLQSSSEELRQVSATILRNLSWHADTASRDMLREVGAVAGLVKAAMVTTEENTLRCILSALWNLSAHSTENKAEICAIEGALGFLVNMLSYHSASDSLAIVENAGGVLRNISSQIAVRDDYREVLRQHNCLQALVKHLKSSNLTILNNICGIVWNLSAKCVVDQDALIKAGAVDLLSSLTSSKHKMIALSASAALRNLLQSAQKRSDARHGDSVSSLIIHKHQDFIVNNIDASTICDESLFFENIYEYIPMSDLKRKFEIQKKLELRKNNSTENCSRGGESNGEDTELCQSFNNLNISMQSRYHNSKPKYLPPAPKAITSSPSTYIPVRNKFSDCAFEDEIESSEQPIDYSRKYDEIKVNTAQSEKVAKSFSYAKSVKENKNSGIYAETDLDQPTDYSLQYAEDDSDYECDEKVSKNAGEEFVQDTVKTYCTEGTPYETPFNFSTATSMSDVRVETNETRSKAIDKPRDVIDSPDVQFKDSIGGLQRKTTTEIVKSTYSSPEKPVTYCDEGLPGSYLQRNTTSEIPKSMYSSGLTSPEKPVTYCDEGPPGYLQRKPTAEIVKSTYSSGIMSPEKPVNYCDEGTPGYFSRVCSYCSLTNEDDKEKDKLEEDVGVKTTETSVPKESNKVANNSAEAKVVKFEEVVDYADETPLMFSRCSSVGSFDSNEQHLINDDSSIVSDFSRRTSGVVSPSELPDSPTQMLLPSRKTAPFSSRSTSQDEKPLNLVRVFIPKSTVFDDKIINYKDENTPQHFSSATSLSSITIDDESERHSNSEHCKEANESREEQCDNSTNSQDESEEVKHEVSNELADELLDQDDENDDEILAACIKMGMPSKRSLKQEKTSSQYDVRSISTPTRTEGNGECLSDGSFNLSEDDYKILAECIQAGMPRSRSAAGSTSMGSGSYSNFANEKKFGSLKKSKNTDLTKQSKLYLHGSSSHETGLNSKAINLRIQPVLKSSCSDCSPDRLVAGLTPRQHSTPVRSSNLNDNGIPYTSYQVSSRNQPYGAFEEKNARLSRHDESILAKCIQNGMSKTTQQKGSFPSVNRDTAKNNAESLPNLSLKAKPHSFGQGRSNVHPPYLPQNRLNTGDICGMNGGPYPNQRMHNINLFPRNTAIPVPPGFMKTTSQLTKNLKAISSMSAQNHNPVPFGTVNDPRLIHPAMEHFDGVKSPVDGVHTDKMIPKVKKSKNVQELQKKGYLNSFVPIRDEVEKYAVENSPSYYSLRSSLSDLTVDGSVAGVVSHLTSRVVSPHPEEDLSYSAAHGACSNEHKTVEDKDEQNCEQKEKEEPEGSFVFLSEEDDDDDILAACIQMGMRGKSLRGQSKSEVPKQISDIASNNVCPANGSNVNDSQCVTPEPLVGRLETGVVNRLSFKLKDTVAATNETPKESKIVQNSSSKQNAPSTSTGQPNSLNLIPDHSSTSPSRRESFSLHTAEFVSKVETDDVSPLQPSSPVKVAECSDLTQPISPKSSKRAKRSKSRRVLVEKMGRVVDLLKLRKN